MKLAPTSDSWSPSGEDALAWSVGENSETDAETVDAYINNFAGYEFVDTDEEWAPNPYQPQAYDYMLALLYPFAGFLVNLPDGPFLNIGKDLDCWSLGQLDRACKDLHARSNAYMGVWYARGCSEYKWVELHSDGAFDLVARSQSDAERECGPRDVLQRHVDWKRRYWKFQKDLLTFVAPFCGTKIQQVPELRNDAYCNCMMRVSRQSQTDTTGACIRFDVSNSPDALWFAVICDDAFDAHGSRLLAFEPNTGSVYKELVTPEWPQRLQGRCLKLLEDCSDDICFVGSVAVYVFQGRLAFFRKSAFCSTWETTGFVTDVPREEDSKLSFFVDFRNAGAYNVNISDVSAHPPMSLGAPCGIVGEDDWYTYDSADILRRYGLRDS